jgi:hypothetical protein
VQSSGFRSERIDTATAPHVDHRRDGRVIKSREIQYRSSFSRANVFQGAALDSSIVCVRQRFKVVHRACLVPRADPEFTHTPLCMGGEDKDVVQLER